MACYQAGVEKSGRSFETAGDLADAIMVSCRAERRRVHDVVSMKLAGLGVGILGAEKSEAKIDHDDRETVISWIVHFDIYGLQRQAVRLVPGDEFSAPRAMKIFRC